MTIPTSSDPSGDQGAPSSGWNSMPTESSFPTQDGSAQGGYSNSGGMPAQDGGSFGGGYPPAGGGSGYPPASGSGGYPPASGGYPPAGGSGGFPPASGGFPPAAGGYPPAAGGYPPAGGTSTGYGMPGGYGAQGSYGAGMQTGATPAGTGTSGLAIASLVLGIVSIIPFLGFFTGLGALITGVIALVQTSKTGQPGKGLAIAGIVITILIIAGWSLLFAVGHVIVHDNSN